MVAICSPSTTITQHCGRLALSPQQFALHRPIGTRGREIDLSHVRLGNVHDPLTRVVEVLPSMQPPPGWRRKRGRRRQGSDGENHPQCSRRPDGGGNLGRRQRRQVLVLASMQPPPGWRRKRTRAGLSVPRWRRLNAAAAGMAAETRRPRARTRGSGCRLNAAAAGMAAETPVWRAGWTRNAPASMQPPPGWRRKLSLAASLRHHAGRLNAAAAGMAAETLSVLSDGSVHPPSRPNMALLPPVWTAGKPGREQICGICTSIVARMPA